MKTQNRNIEKFDTVFVSRRRTVKDLMAKLHRIYKEFYQLEDKKGPLYPARLWKVDPLCDFRTVVPKLMFDRTTPFNGKILKEDLKIEVSFPSSDSI